MSGKPVVFFSHSSRDKEQLFILKELFMEKTGGTVEVFLSSDGQSIPLGRNWVHRIEEALGEAKLLITFITENSVRSSWVSFEAGFAYSKGVRVVPVGFLGIDIAKVPPPLSLLQGFNIRSADGLDNLVALVNEVFHHQHRARFTEEDYVRVMGSASMDDEEESWFSSFVDEVTITFPKAHLSDDESVSRAEATARLLSAEAIFGECYAGAKTTFPGGQLYISGANPNEKTKNPTLTLDPTVFDTYGEKFEQLQTVLGCNVGEIQTVVRFIDGVTGLGKQHKASARLMDCGIKLDGDSFRFGPFCFTVSQSSGWRSETSTTQLTATHSGPGYPLDELEELIELLFEREVLEFDEPIPY